jgi:hypothetical protein
MGPFDGPPRNRTCKKCDARPATQWWIDEGLMGAVHGSYAAWCQLPPAKAGGLSLS